jgi:hypothetical protein
MFKDAEAWARHVEIQADRNELPGDPKVLQRLTLGELVERYRDTVSIKKRSDTSVVYPAIKDAAMTATLADCLRWLKLVM